MAKQWVYDKMYVVDDPVADYIDKLERAIMFAVSGTNEIECADRITLFYRKEMSNA